MLTNTRTSHGENDLKVLQLQELISSLKEEKQKRETQIIGQTRRAAVKEQSNKADANSVSAGHQPSDNALKLSAQGSQPKADSNKAKISVEGLFFTMDSNSPSAADFLTNTLKITDANLAPDKLEQQALY